MKIIGIIILTTLAFVQVIVLLLLCLYLNSINRNWISKEGRQSRNDVVLLQKDEMVAFRELALIKSIRTECSQLNFTFVSHVIEPHFEETSSNPFLLVLIMSGVHTSYQKRRNSIRSLWGNEFDHAASRAWKRVFVLGTTQDSQLQSAIRNESAKFNDILLLDIEDNYDNLVIKTFSGFLWGMVHVNPRYILKADDDVYVRIPYLISWLDFYGTDMFYGGRVKLNNTLVIRGAGRKNSVARDCMVEDYYPPYCSGPFYVVSSKALLLMFQSINKLKAIQVEDAYVGMLARESGLKPVNIPGFYLTNIKHYKRCNWVNAVALGHNYESAEKIYIQKKIQEHSNFRNYIRCFRW